MNSNAHLRKIILALLISFLPITTLTAQHANEGFYSNRPATTWEESLVSGNGTMGLLVAGHVYNEAQVFNHTNLFMPIHEPLTPPSQGNHLRSIQHTMLTGDFQVAANFLVELSHADGFGRKRQSDLYIPAFQLNIRSDSLPVKSYRRKVDFTSGEVKVSWENRKGSFIRRSFVSRADNVAVTEISGTRPIDLRLNLSLITRFDPKRKVKFCLNDSLNVARMEQQIDTQSLAIKVWYATPWQGGHEGYEGLIRVVRQGGVATVKGDTLHIEKAERVLLLCEVAPVTKIATTDQSRFADHLNSLSSSYEQLLAPHRAIHSNLMQRISLSLGTDNRYANLSSEELLALGGDHPALIERLFAASRYNILSATGVNPPNLQGIWGATMTPPWAGDYTTNGNLPTAVSHYLAASTPELMLSLFNKLESQLDDYRTNARVLFKCRGIHLPSHICLHGYDNQFDATWPMTFWTAGAAWYSMFYYDYYLYTQDKEFLRNRALPWMLESVDFYEDFLTQEVDGKLIFNPSYSPENHPTNNRSQACINATMDIAVTKALLRDLIAACHTLNMHTDRIPRWEEMLAKLPDYALNERGEFREWCWQDLADNHQHRHASHLIGLFYRHDPEIMNSEALKEGVRRAIRARMDFRKTDSTGGVMAFGLSQLAFPACALGDSEIASELLTMAAENYYNNNLMTTHDPHKIFNTDMSGAYPAMVLNMLCNSDLGTVSLLPACPKAWTQGELCGASLRGGIHMKRLHWCNEQIEVTLTSQQTQIIRLFIRGQEHGTIHLKAGEPTTLKL